LLDLERRHTSGKVFMQGVELAKKGTREGKMKL
jgi:hypothetical protein